VSNFKNGGCSTAHNAYLTGGLHLAVDLDVQDEIATLVSTITSKLCQSECPLNEPVSGFDAPIIVLPKSNLTTAAICEGLSCSRCSGGGSMTAMNCSLQLELNKIHFSFMGMTNSFWNRDANYTSGCYVNTEDVCTGTYPSRIIGLLLFVGAFLLPHVAIITIGALFFGGWRPKFRRNASYYVSSVAKCMLVANFLVMAIFGALTITANVTVHDIITLLGAMRSPYPAGHRCEDKCKATIGAEQSDVCSSLCAFVFRLDAPLTNTKIPFIGRVVVSSDIAPVFGLGILVTLLLASYSEDLDERRSTRLVKPGLLHRQGSRAARVADGMYRPGGFERRGVRAQAVEPRAWRLGVAIRSLLALLHLAAVVVALALPWGNYKYGGPLGDVLRLVPGAISEEPFRLLAFTSRFFQPPSVWSQRLLAVIMLVTVVGAPIVRSVTQLALLHVPMPMRRARLLHRFSKRVTYIYGLQVFTGLYLILSVTATNLGQSLTLVLPEQLYAAFNEPYGNPFSISFEAGQGIYSAVAAIVLAFVSAFDGSETHKYIHARLYAGEDCPPYTACGPDGKSAAVRRWREHARPRDRLDRRSE